MATHLPAMYAVSALFILKLEAKVASSSQSHEFPPLPGTGIHRHAGREIPGAREA
jgi:hypothetical protein